MPELDHLSYSSISKFLSCGRQFRFHYIDRQPEPTSPALAYGSAWHNTIEEVIRSMALHQSADIAEIWHTHTAAEFAKVPESGWDDGDTPAELTAAGLKCLLHDDVITAIGRIRPLMIDGAPVIEKKIELRVPGVPIPIVGYIDVIGADRIPIDLKTSEKAWPVDRAAGELQTLFYLAACLQLGLPSPGMAFRHIIFPKSGRVRVQIFEHSHTPAELFWLFSLIQECWKGINAGVFVPNPSSFLCSPRYCNFWDICRGRK